MSDPFSPLSEREVNEGLWILQHRRTIGNIVRIVLACVDAIFLIVVMFGVIQELRGIQDRQQMERALVGPSIVRSVESPAPLVSQNIQTILHGTTMDIVIALTNPNAEFAATVDYTVLSGGEPLGHWQDVVPPQRSTHLLALGVARTADTLRFESISVVWQRTNAHREGTYAAWVRRVGDVRVVKSAREATSIGTGVSFTIENGSAFHLRRIPVVILLSSGDSVVGANTITVNVLPSGSQRSLDVRWSENLPPSTALTVEPHVNLFDQSNRYVPAVNGGTEQRRD